MGSCQTKLDQSPDAPEEELTPLELRTAEAVRIIKEQQGENARRINGFDGVVMRFPRIATAFRAVKAIFDEFDDDRSGSIDKDEIKNVLVAMGTEMPDEDVDEMFKEAKMSEGGQDLSFREFLLFISLGSVLKLFPQMSTLDEQEKKAAEGPAAAGGSADQASGEGQQAMLKRKGRELVLGLKLVLECWWLLDQDGNGSVDRDELLQNLREQQSKRGPSRREEAGTAGDLSDERWKQLDHDGNGAVTLRELVYAMYEWVGFDDDDEEAAEEEAAAVAAAAAGGGEAAADDGDADAAPAAAEEAAAPEAEIESLEG